jgi:hypothetical protein
MISDSLNSEQLLALRIAFDKACVELGIGANSDDEDRREQLAVMMLSIASGGERDTEVIPRARRAPNATASSAVIQLALCGSTLPASSERRCEHGPKLYPRQFAAEPKPTSWRILTRQ